MVAVLQSVSQGQIIPIDRAVVLVGRGSDCDAIINNSQKISRRHCCLVQVDNDYYVRDLGSMNGVWLNGDKVHREAVLKTGDSLSIGDVEFLFHPNARIEQKRTVATPVTAPPPPAVEDSHDALSDDILQVDDSLDVVDDVIPLDQLEDADDDDSLLIEGAATYEVESIDAPIVDDEDADDRDELIVFDD